MAEGMVAEPARFPALQGYGRQLIEPDDVAAVVDALKSEHLAHGPRVDRFEASLAQACGAREAVACSSGTTALQLALMGLDVGPGAVCIVPAVTFLSTATAALWLGAEVRLADVDPETGLMTPSDLDDALARLPDAGRHVVLPVHLGGRLCDLDAMAPLARAAGAAVVEDAAHAIGGTDAGGATVGACRLSDAAAFSFHPVKTLAAGEGGAVTLNDPDRAARLRRLRNHGVTRDAGLMSEPGSFGPDGEVEPFAYEQLELGLNARMDEMSAALAASQLAKLDRFVTRRAALADLYDRALAPLAPRVLPVGRGRGRPGLHLYMVRLEEGLHARRGAIMRRLRAEGVASQVHYIPLYRQPFLASRLGPDALPGAEAWFAGALSLPLHPAMAEDDVLGAVEALARAID